MSEYHRHSSGDVVQGSAARCIDPDAGAVDVSVIELRAPDSAVEEWETYIEEAVAATSGRDDLIARLRDVVAACR